MFDKNGIILLNKPTGMSSFLAVKKTLKLLGASKAGHMGTLDPLGCGLLLIGINKGTKLFDEYLNKRKTYRAVFKFGVETDTLDSEGQILNQNEINVKEDCIKGILADFIGKQSQLPPKFSAKKVNGKKACDLARKGISVELKPKEIEIFDFKLISKLKENEFLFEIECSAGTYIRSLCRDLAYKLHTFGTMCSIIRTKCGIFDIKDSCTLDDLNCGNLAFVEI